MTIYSEGYLRAITDVLHEITREGGRYVERIEERGLDPRDGGDILTRLFEDVTALGNLCVETTHE